MPKDSLFIKHRGTGKAQVFVDDEKLTLEAEVNCRISLVIARNLSDIPPVIQTKNPASLMVFGDAGSDISVMNSDFITVGV